MYIIYSQYYDEINLIGTTSNEQDAKAYCEKYKEIESLYYQQVEHISPDESLWPEIQKVYIAYKNSDKDQIARNIVTTYARNVDYINELCKIDVCETYAKAGSLISKEDAKEKLKQTLENYQVVPVLKYNQIRKSFVHVEEIN